MSPESIPALKPEVQLPADQGLPGLLHLFDSHWVWETFCEHFGRPDEIPQRIRASQLRYQPGMRALVSYAVEWEIGCWSVDDQFAIELVAERPDKVFRYPDDPYLPGLRLAGEATSAHDLLVKHIGIFPRRVRVEPVRYRPSTRAVLRHVANLRPARLGSLTLFARVMPPRRVNRLLEAAELAENSGFRVPPLLGVWPEGGTVWMTAVPGETMRNMIRKGEAPGPREILDALAGLWNLKKESGKGHPLDLLGGFEMTQRLLAHLVEDEVTKCVLERITDVLGQFAQAWQPSAVAHNDFYDDQVLVTPEGKLALVDFEEIGPGDPLLDIANMLAHLRWMARFGNAPEECTTYRRNLRAEALAHFSCDGQTLDLREAYSIFRLSAGPVRQLRRNWAKRIKMGLTLASEVLEGAP